MPIQSVPNLVQGVTQQAAQMQRDSQCALQFDCINSPADGAVSRPGGALVKYWAGRSLLGAAFSEIERDGENYLTGIFAGAPFAIDLADGTDCTITGIAPLNVDLNADSYLNTSGGLFPRDTFRWQIVEDTSFVISRNVTVAMAAASSAVRNPEALVFVRSGSYSTTYTVTLTGPATQAASFTTPQSDLPADEDLALTSNIATQLTAGLNANGYTAVRDGSTIKITRADNVDFNVSTEDGSGDDFMYAFKGKVSSFSRLPRRAFSGMTFEVAGDTRTQADNFWVQFQGPSATGLWNEVVAPDVPLGFNIGTMPHVLKNTGFRLFTWGQQAWSSRIAGDEDTAPDPSFVSRKVRDVFFHNNRLGLLHDAGVVLSKSRFPFTWFPDTVQTLLATAPIDYRVVPSGASGGSSRMDFAVMMDEGLFLWSQKFQARITAAGTEVLKQDTTEAPASSAFEYAAGCDPRALGTLLFFPTEAGLWATLRALQYANGKPIGDTDVTTHVQKYIASGVRGITASDTLRHLFLWSDGEPDVLYLWNFLMDDRQFVQSAWNKWRIRGGTVIWASIKNNQLRVLQQRSAGLAYLVFDLTPGAVDPDAGADYLTRLDLRVTGSQVTGFSYNVATDTSSFTLPYAYVGTAEDFIVVVREDNPTGFTRGRVFPTVTVVGSVVTVKGNLTGYLYYAGQRITSERVESRFYHRSEEGAVAYDRLVVNDYVLEMSDTGYTRIEVITPNKPAGMYEFQGRTLGTDTAQVGKPQIGTAHLKASVGEEAANATIRIVNDSFLPARWQKADWDYTGIGLKGKQ